MSNKLLDLMPDYAKRRVDRPPLSDYATPVDIATEIYDVIGEAFFPIAQDSAAALTTSGDTGLHLPREQAIWLLDSNGEAIRTYSADGAGFANANLAASSGDVIWVPPATFGGDQSITAGVKVIGASRYATIFSGQLTLGVGSSLENLSVERSSNNASTLKGVIGPGSTGTAYINCCDIEAVNSGSGDARGISMETSGSIVECWNCYLYGSSGSGTGLAAWRDTGTTASLYIYGGRAQGSTQTFNE